MKLLLVLIVLLVACTTAAPAPTTMPASSAALVIPGAYYSHPCQKPAHLTFYDWMVTLEVPPYEKDAFDCSQQAAYVEWLSENCNHRAVIVGERFGDYGHIWTLIDIGGVPFAYEPSRDLERRWVPRTGAGSTHFHYTPTYKWESIHETPYKLDGLEFAWWLTYPSLMTTVWKEVK